MIRRYFISDHQLCATPLHPLDDGCSAGRPYRCAWRARSRRSYTHDTCERWYDAKPSSEDALVDGISWPMHRRSFSFKPFPKTIFHRSSIDRYPQTLWTISSQTAYFCQAVDRTRRRETPEPDDTDAPSSRRQRRAVWFVQCLLSYRAKQTLVVLDWLPLIIDLKLLSILHSYVLIILG